MDKKTQMLLGGALLVVAGYMVYKKMQKKKETPAPAAKEFAGTEMDTVVGDRMRGLNAANANVQDSGWVRGADGSSIAPTFFDTQSSDWVR